MQRKLPFQIKNQEIFLTIKEINHWYSNKNGGPPMFRTLSSDPQYQSSDGKQRNNNILFLKDKRAAHNK